MPVFVRPFVKTDLNAFEPIEPVTKDQEFSPEMSQAIEDSGLAVTGLRNGKIFGCGGVHPLSDGQGELWLRLSKNCLKHRLDTLRWLRDSLKIIEETFPFKQLNAIIRCDFKPSIKLVKFLGFKLIQTSNEWLIFSKRVKE